ncbi:MAG: phosphoenolpyruvate--protein phosphotransferase [Candidatus Kapaibacteriales bacterium]
MREGILEFKGLPVSSGTAAGRLCIAYRDHEISDPFTLSNSSLKPLILEDKLNFQTKNLNFNLDIDTQKEQCKNSFVRLENIYSEQLQPDLPPTVRSILDTKILLLTDQILIDEILELIDDGITFHSAISQKFNEKIKLLKLSQNEELWERHKDLEEIRDELLRLDSTQKNESVDGIKITKQGLAGIILAERITTLELLGLLENPEITGIATVEGSITSHFSIMARSYGIPTVVGLDKQVFREIKAIKEEVLFASVDGDRGILRISTNENEFETNESQGDSSRSEGRLKEESHKTRCGTQASLMINADFPELIEKCRDYNPDGYGLVRSEHILLKHNSFPNVPAQENWYSDISEKAYPKPVTIRLFDFGSDKFPEIIGKKENNPALGMRGVRFLISEQKKHDNTENSILYGQLEALVRANKRGNISIMVPMVVTLSEFDCVRNTLDRVNNDLIAKGIIQSASISLGTMIETPAAVILADRLASRADFFSIGSNDLAQYTLAADRTNPELGRFFRWLDITLLRMIISVIDAAKPYGIPVSICGEVASNEFAIPLLLWSGLKSFSVSPANYDRLCSSVSSYHQNDFDKTIRKLMEKDDDTDMLAIIEELTSSQKKKKVLGFDK